MQKLAFKIAGTLTVAALCLAAAICIMHLQWRYVNEANSISQGVWRSLVIFLTSWACWIPISVSFFTGVALRKAWLIATVPAYLLIWLVPALTIRLLIMDEYNDVANRAPDSFEGLPPIEEYTRIKGYTPGMLEPHDRNALLSGAVSRIVTLNPISWDPRYDALPAVDLERSEAWEFRRVKIDECPSAEFINLPVGSDLTTASCIQRKPFEGELPDWALVDLERSRGKFHEDVFAAASLAPLPESSATGSATQFRLTHEQESIQQTRHFRALSFLPQLGINAFYSLEDPSLWRISTSPIGLVTAVSPEHDMDQLYKDIFPNWRDVSTDWSAGSGIDRYIPNAGPYQYKQHFQKITRTKMPEEWLEDIQVYHDTYFQAAPDASRDTITRRLRRAALVMCYGGYANQLTAQILARYSKMEGCIDYLSTDLQNVYYSAHTDYLKRNKLQDELLDARKKRLKDLANALGASDQFTSIITPEGTPLRPKGAPYEPRKYLQDDLQLEAILYPGDVEYDAQLTAYFRVPKFLDIADSIHISCPGMIPVQIADHVPMTYRRTQKMSVGEASLPLPQDMRPNIRAGLVSGNCRLEVLSQTKVHSLRLPVGREYYILDGLNGLDAANIEVGRIRALALELESMN